MLLFLVLTLVPFSRSADSTKTARAINPRYWLNMGEPWLHHAAIVTTCGSGSASHNAGEWKPRLLMDGVAAMAKSVRSVHSKLPILILSFTSDPMAYTECIESKTLRRAGATCHELDDTAKEASGYGYAKITAILGAPARVIIWIDADAWFLANPDHLVHEAISGPSSALFWPDYYNHFYLPSNIWERVGPIPTLSLCLASRRYYDCVHCLHDGSDGVPCPSDSMLQPQCICDHGYRAHDDGVPAHALSWPFTQTYNRSHWSSAQGFDSGFLVVDKAKSMRQLHRLERLARPGTMDARKYSRYSNGDKDLWHLAWMLDHAPYELNPYAAHVAARRNTSITSADSLEPPLFLVSQLKLDHDGQPLVLHQNWQELQADDTTALVVVDLRLCEKVPFGPEINLGFRFPKDGLQLPSYLQNGTRSPAPSKILDSISNIRREWHMIRLRHH